jgi:hypothetical protein
MEYASTQIPADHSDWTPRTKQLGNLLWWGMHMSGYLLHTLTIVSLMKSYSNRFSWSCRTGGKSMKRTPFLASCIRESQLNCKDFKNQLAIPSENPRHPDTILLICAKHLAWSCCLQVW